MNLPLLPRLPVVKFVYDQRELRPLDVSIVSAYDMTAGAPDLACLNLRGSFFTQLKENKSALLSLVVRVVKFDFE